MSADDIRLPMPEVRIHVLFGGHKGARIAESRLPKETTLNPGGNDLFTEEQVRAAILADRASRAPSPQGDAEFEVWQDEVPVASASGPRAAALAEIEHYAAVYGQDGPVEVYEIQRTRINAARSTPAKGGE